MSTIRLSVLAIVAWAFMACTAARPKAVTQPTPKVIVLAPTCTTIAPNADRVAKRLVPGAAYLEVTPNTPRGNRVGYAGTWGPQGPNQVVLALRLFSWKEPGCSTPEVTNLIMEVPPAPFILGRWFALRDQDGTLYASGIVMHGGKIDIKFLPPLPLPIDGIDRYFTLELDTSGAGHGDELAVTTSIVEYQVNGLTYRLYQPRYTPPPMQY